MTADKPKKPLLEKLSYFFGAVWLSTLSLFIVYLVAATNFFRTGVDQGPLQGDIWLALLGLDVLVGIFAFLIGVLCMILWSITSPKKEKTTLLTRIKNVLQFVMVLAFFPIVLLFRTWQPQKLFRLRSHLSDITLKRLIWWLIKNVVATGVIVVLLLPVWFAGYVTVGTMTAYRLGYVSRGIAIAGTGSMYPTFPKGEGKDPKELAQQVVGTPGMFPYPNGLVLFGRRYFNHEITRGDIVLVENDKVRQLTQEMYGSPSGWVKRVVAVSGDTIEIRDGVLYLNKEPLSEPYIAKARSTFGQSFLKECQVITVPEHSIFVMGDNRTGSGDSREIGFFSVDDIKFALPLRNQEGKLKEHWRDTTKDLEETSRIQLNKETYVAELNKRREEAGAKPLKYQPKLEESARKRGEMILKYDDYSFEATRSGYTMERAMREVGYYNTIWGEAPTAGYFEAEELLENQFEFPESKKFLLDKEYQDIGIAEVQMDINGCPTHMIVQHFGGYVPPNYSSDMIQSWEGLVGSLRSVLPGWSSLRDSGDFYTQHKGQVDRLLQIIETRIAKASDVVSTMRANRWLSATQQKYVEYEDYALAREQDQLADFLNSQ